MGGKTKRETRLLLRKGEKLRATVARANVSDVFYGYAAAAEALGGSAKNENTLSVMLPGTYESWNVLASDVKVVCVPRESEDVKKYFPGLPEIEWEPE
jgi:hypothetical protein